MLDKLTYAGNTANLEGLAHELVVGDIGDRGRRRAAAAGCDAIVNFAAETHVDRSILGAARVRAHRCSSARCACSRRRAAPAPRFVQVSTDEVYGDLAERRLLGETDPLAVEPLQRREGRRRPARPAYVRTFGVHASITRGSNTYGPNQYPEKFIPLFVTNALEGEPLPVYGDGKQIRDWL